MRNWGVLLLVVLCSRGVVLRAEDQSRPTSYMPVVETEDFAETVKRLRSEKEAAMEGQFQLLASRYDLSDRPHPTAQMSKGKRIQAGIRVRLRQDLNWTTLAASSPGEIRSGELWPKGFLPLPHPRHKEGGMLFPPRHIEAIKQAEGRDLVRFDLDFDVPEHFLPEFPPPIYLTTRPDLGDVSQGQVVTLSNYYTLFQGVLNPKQLEGFRLLLTPFPQQQFNATDDRRSIRPHQGVACFDCHVNGHTNAAIHLVGDIRPQSLRHRLDTPTLRGVHIQRLFGSQRALRTIEDFTEFEQRAAYFDGDPVVATKKGVNPLERSTQVQFMAELQELIDFPPAPKLDILGNLDSRLASEAELRGERLFHGKAKCGICHPAPYYTDNLMHNLRTERFFEPQEVNGRFAHSDGPIKTFPLRGIKDSPPYLHDGRLLTLEDTVEFFNLVLQTQLSEEEKRDLADFLLAL